MAVRWRERYMVWGLLPRWVQAIMIGVPLREAAGVVRVRRVVLGTLYRTIRGESDGDTAERAPHRVGPRGAVHVPVPARRGGEDRARGYRPRGDARGGHRPLCGRDRPRRRRRGRGDHEPR